jgi:hypothetical protein
MIIVKLQGGLGNQLFQYAIARSLASRLKTTFKLDISWYRTQGDVVRHYELHRFNITEHIASDAEVRAFKRYQKKGRKIWFLYNYICADESKYVREKGYRFNPHMFNLTGDFYLDGVWISEKYFRDISPIIRADLVYTAPLSVAADTILKQIRASESVSVHIRRGDFVTSAKSHAGPLSLEYYHDAIKRVRQQATNPLFFIFSDDIAWVKANLNIDIPVVYVSDPNNISDCEELVLMSHCSQHIIANSTFSWWGAWLDPRPNKIVIAPSTWFKQETHNAFIRDLVPEAWKLM